MCRGSIATGKNGGFVRFLFVLSLIGNQATCTPEQIVLLVSYDGFRYDYLDTYKDRLPTLNKIANEGTRAEYVENVFPTSTFPNHYTIVTGLYPESHGLIGNKMYDPVFNSSFTMINNESKWWQGGEPVWVTNEKQGYKSGNCYWPGFDVKIRGHLPYYRPTNETFGKPFAGSKNVMLWKRRIDMVVNWLNKTDPPSFVALYFEDPDEIGHKFGIESLEMGNVLEMLDNHTSYLMEQLRRLELFNRINIIFTADHGMTNFTSQTILHLGKYVDMESVLPWRLGGTSFLVTNSSKSTLEDLFKSFKKMEKETGQLKVYKKDETPEYLHFSHNRRIADIVGIVASGYVLDVSKFGNGTILANETCGAHGYDPRVPGMHPYLLAYGPAFKQGYKSGPIRMIDLYPLMCHILDIKPSANNGSLQHIQHLLRSSESWLTHSGWLIAIGTVCTILIIFSIYISIVVYRKCRYRLAERAVLFNRNVPDWEKNRPLMDSDDEEDEIVIM